MRSKYESIYAEDAARYDALVACEDHARNLERALLELLDDGVESHGVECAVELGAGTGRVTRLIARRAARVLAFDGSAHMIEHARVPAHVTLGVADNASLPVDDGCADVSVAGWTIGHNVGWHPTSWVERVDRVVEEMLRVVRVGGRAIVIETLGTGTIDAGPPNPGLAEYYARLEEHHGFTRQVIRTDYRFADLDEAIASIGFFFGEALAERVRERGWVVVPEHTGIWHRRR